MHAQAQLYAQLHGVVPADDAPLPEKEAKGIAAITEQRQRSKRAGTAGSTGSSNRPVWRPGDAPWSPGELPRNSHGARRPTNGDDDEDRLSDAGSHAGSLAFLFHELSLALIR